MKRSSVIVLAAVWLGITAGGCRREAPQEPPPADPVPQARAEAEQASARLMAEDIADLRVQPGNHVFVSKKGGKKEKKAPAPASTKKGKKKGKRGRKKSKGSTASLDSF